MEQRIIFEAENDLDKYKAVLAKTMAVARMNGLPLDDRCVTCYNALPIADQLDVDRRTEVEVFRTTMFQKYVCRPVTKESKRKDAVFAVKAVLAFVAIVVFVTVLLLINMGCSSKASKPEAGGEYNDDKVWEIISWVQRNVRDVDYDHKVNCCDYALMFKMRWDERYSGNDCEIVWNVNKSTNFNHLFVRVWLYDGWECVEPRAEWESCSYNPKDFWGRRYNARYNTYGQTNFWMMTASRNGVTRNYAYMKLGISAPVF